MRYFKPELRSPHNSKTGVQVSGSNPEHFAFGFLGVEPKQRQTGIALFQVFATAADLA
jgi:hypothetical protein